MIFESVCSFRDFLSGSIIISDKKLFKFGFSEGYPAIALVQSTFFSKIHIKLKTQNKEGGWYNPQLFDEADYIEIKLNDNLDYDPEIIYYKGEACRDMSLCEIDSFCIDEMKLALVYRGILEKYMIWNTPVLQ